MLTFPHGCSADFLRSPVAGPRNSAKGALTACVAGAAADLRSDLGELLGSCRELSGFGGAASASGRATGATVVGRVALRWGYEPCKEAFARSGDGCPGCAVSLRKRRRTGHAAALGCDGEERGGAEPAGGARRPRGKLRGDAASDVGDWQETPDAYAALSGRVPRHQGRVGTQQVHPQLHVEKVAGRARSDRGPEWGRSRRPDAHSDLQTLAQSLRWLRHQLSLQPWAPSDRAMSRPRVDSDYRRLPLDSGQGMVSAQIARGFGRPTIACVRLLNCLSTTGTGMATQCPAKARDSTAVGESSK